MDTDAIKVGTYIMQSLDYAAENCCNIAEINFSADELINILRGAELQPQEALNMWNAELASLNPQAMICEQELARLLRNDPRTIRAMVERRELPPPIEFGNKKVWFPGRILKFINDRMDQAEREFQRMCERKARLTGGVS